MMNKLKYIILLVLTAMSAACSDDASSYDAPSSTGNNEPISLNFSIATQSETEINTRAKGDEGEIKSIYVFEFDENGFYIASDYVTSIQKETGVGGESLYKFSAKILSSDGRSPRFIHFVALEEVLSDSGLEDMNFLSGMDIFSTLYVDKAKTAYWQYIKHDGKINEKTNLSSVQVVRNKVKISVHDATTEEKFLKGFEVINQPDRGSIAPYNLNGKRTNRFPLMNKETTYDKLLEQKYYGFMPPKTKIVHTGDADNWEATDYPFNKDDKYIYERPSKDGQKNNTFIIVKGIYEGKVHYYKMSIVRKTKEHPIPKRMHILRNFNYILNIIEVNGPGFPTPEEAAQAAPSNDLIGSVELEDFTNISNGKSCIFVEYINKVIVSDAPVALKYKYIPDLKKSPNTSKNRNVVVRNDDNDNQILFDQSQINNINNTIKYISTDSEGWSTITLNPKNGVMGEQSIFVADKDYKVWRKVTFVRNQQYTLTAKLDKNVYADIPGTPMLLTWKISSTLEKYIFPLKFKIQSDELNINPSNSHKLPIEYGESLDGKHPNSYYFIKELTWDTYQTMCQTAVDGKVELNARLQISKSLYVGTDCTLRVQNPYFEEGKMNFTVINFNWTTLDKDMIVDWSSGDYTTHTPVKYKASKGGSTQFIKVYTNPKVPLNVGKGYENNANVYTINCDNFDGSKREIGLADPNNYFPHHIYVNLKQGGNMTSLIDAPIMYIVNAIYNVNVNLPEYSDEWNVGFFKYRWKYIYRQEEKIEGVYLPIGEVEAEWDVVNKILKFSNGYDTKQNYIFDGKMITVKINQYKQKQKDNIIFGWSDVDGEEYNKTYTFTMPYNDFIRKCNGIGTFKKR